MSKLRTFIAVDLPLKTKEEISVAIEFLQRETGRKVSDSRIVWEDQQKFHITLVFLGNILQERMEVAAKIAQEVAENATNLELKIDGLSYFVKDRSGPDSIINLAVLDPEHELRDLYKNLSRSLSGEGFWPAERLIPHITIGRLKGKKLHPDMRKSILAQIAEIDVPKIEPFLVDRINVYESIQSGDSARYHLLKSFPLGST